jgi:hypothetical protein
MNSTLTIIELLLLHSHLRCTYTFSLTCTSVFVYAVYVSIGYGPSLDKEDSCQGTYKNNGKKNLQYITPPEKLYCNHDCQADVFGRTDNRMMAARASVTWTHCSVLFEVTWDKTRCVRADALASVRTRARPRGRPCARGHSPASARMRKKINK